MPFRFNIHYSLINIFDLTFEELLFVILSKYVPGFNSLTFVVKEFTPLINEYFFAITFLPDTSNTSRIISSEIWEILLEKLRTTSRKKNVIINNLFAGNTSLIYRHITAINDCHSSTPRNKEWRNSLNLGFDFLYFAKNLEAQNHPSKVWKRTW